MIPWLLCLFALSLLIVYFKSKYFTLRGPIPGQCPQFFVGNLIQAGLLFNGSSLPEAFAKWKDRFGDVFQFYLGPTRVVAVNNLVDVEHVFTHRNIYDQGDIYLQQFGIVIPHALIANKGPKYKRHAALALPLFRHGKIISNFDLIVESTCQLLLRWQENASDHIYFNMTEECQHLLLTIFGFIGFDYDLEVFKTKKTKENNELTKALKDFLDTFNIMIYLPLTLARIYFKISPSFRRAQRILENYFDRMIEQELKQTDDDRQQRKRTSLIAALVNSLQKDERIEAMKREEEKRGLSRAELLDEMRLFLLAGFETTSTGLAWFIHLMSKYPQVQQKIKKELKNENENDELTLDRLDKLTYLDCVLKEVFRFCPPINGTARTLNVDDCLPESGIQLYKGDQVLIPFHNLAHDDRYWKIDPKQFYPERFLQDDKIHPTYALIPFGQGHRQCMGQELAKFELKVIAATLMKYVTFTDAGPKLNAGGQISGLTIMPRHFAVTVDFDQSVSV